MTTEPKAKGVDVLGVMEAAAKTCKLYGHDKSANELPKARAAVAELIDAARSASKVLGHVANTHLTGKLSDLANDDYKRLDAVLKRIGGEG